MGWFPLSKTPLTLFFIERCATNRHEKLFPEKQAREGLEIEEGLKFVASEWT